MPIGVSRPVEEVAGAIVVNPDWPITRLAAWSVVKGALYSRTLLPYESATQRSCSSRKRCLLGRPVLSSSRHRRMR